MQGIVTKPVSCEFSQQNKTVPCAVCAGRGVRVEAKDGGYREVVCECRRGATEALRLK